MTQLDMTSPDSAYAIYFDEGPGYLLVTPLGRGISGQTMLVRSCAFPYNLYVRKRVPRQANQHINQKYHDEVSNYRHFKYTPKLIDWTSYWPDSYALTMDFCNGGTLEQFMLRIGEKGHKNVSEIFVWKLFLQLLETLEYLHCRSDPPVAHLDLFNRNIFLHWSEDCRPDEKHRRDPLPDFFVGDFGHAKPGANRDALALDLRSLHTVLIQVCRLSTLRPCYIETDKEFPFCYSRELEACITLLPEPWDGRSRPKPPILAVPVSSLRQAIMPVALRKMAELQGKSGPEMDYYSTKPVLPTEIRLEQRKESFRNLQLHEPYFAARVDKNTSAIIAIETKYGDKSRVADGKGLPPTAVKVATQD